MTEARDHLVLPLDVADLATARALARRSPPGTGSSRSATSCGPKPARPRSTRCHEDGFAVFVDLKLLDIPTTVERGAHGPRPPRASTSSTSTRSAASRCSRRRRRPRRRRPGRRARRRRRCASPSPCSPARPTPSAIGKRLGARPGPAAATGWCAPPPRRPRPGALDLAPMVPGIRLDGSDGERPGPRRHAPATRSMPARSGSSSGAASPRPTTRRAPRRGHRRGRRARSPIEAPRAARRDHVGMLAGAQAARGGRRCHCRQPSAPTSVAPRSRRQRTRGASGPR